MIEKKNKGITLVALVITIIILLILAGITISSLTNTGLFGRAKEAKEKTQEAEKNQQGTLAEYEKALNDATTENLTSAMYNKKLSDDNNTTLKDAYGNTFVVPAGFKIVVSDDTNNATTVDKGIVIEDATSGATAGSQFVWIPVGTITKTDGTTKTIELNRYTFDENGEKTAYGEKIINTYYQELEKSDKKNTVAKSITDFKNSVKANGGYYIGRYEARTTTARSDKGDALTQITEKGTDPVYNCVTQQEAASQAQNMYSGDKFTSDLMNSYAWDTATLFIQSCGTNSKYSKQTRISESLLDKGTNTQEVKDLQCNIYDMAGNILEWTTETSSYQYLPFVLRGGSFSFENFYMSDRNNVAVSTGFADDGFRPILYVNV